MIKFLEKKSRRNRGKLPEVFIAKGLMYLGKP